MRYNELKDCFVSDEAKQMIKRQGKEKEIIFYDEVNDYADSYDISNFRLSDGNEEFIIQSFQLSEGSSVCCEYDIEAYIEKDGKKYVWINAGEDEISFILETELYTDMYVVYHSNQYESQYDCYFNYMPVNIYPIFSEEDAKALTN